MAMKEPEENLLSALETALAILAFIAMIAAVTAFYIVFRSNVAGGPESWSNFGDYFSGVLNPIIGLITVVLVVLTLRVTRKEAADTRQKMEDQLRLMRDDQQRQDVKRRLDGLLAEWNRVLGEPPDEVMLMDVQRSVPLPFEVSCIRHMVETPEIHSFLCDQRVQFQITYGREPLLLVPSWNALNANVVPLVHELDRCCDMHESMAGNSNLSDFYRNRVVRAVTTLEVVGLITPETSRKFRGAPT